MKAKLIITIITVLFCMHGNAQMHSDSMLMHYRDSTMQAMIHADSMKANKSYEEALFWSKIGTKAIYPALNIGEYSGVIPVADPTDKPDPNMTYKLLFEITAKNPDSVAKEMNYSLVEVARILNLHVAAGVPLGKIAPVIVVHGPALNAIATNTYYNSKYKSDNPNIKAMEAFKKLGAKVVACGQAMAFLNFTKDDLLPGVQQAMSAKTALSSYQLKGYVLYNIDPEH